MRQGNALRHYYHDTNSGEWISRGDNNYEVVMTRIAEGTSNIRMKHYTFDGLWREGWDFGDNGSGFALAMFQNHASGNNNYELVARSANRMTHFWRD